MSLNYSFEILQENVVLLSFSVSEIDRYMFILNKLLFYSGNHRFISITSNKDELSVIVTENTIKQYLENNLQEHHNYIKYDIIYTVFKIHEYTTDIGKVGIVNNFSKIMSENKIPILYITTYNNDYILVETQYSLLAKSMLISNGLSYIEE